jgi:Outer membrane protein beta-barrel domain
MKSSRLLLGLTAAMLCATAAPAADVPYRPTAAAVAAAAATPNWTGPYVWGYIGAGQSRDTASFDASSPGSPAGPSTTVKQFAKLPDGKTCNTKGGCVIPGAAAVAGVPATNGVDATMNGLLLGGGGGYDWRVANYWVVGLEADMAYSTLHGSSGGGSGMLTRDMTYLGFLGGRVGFLVTPSMLAYFKGGAAFANFNTVASASNGSISVSDTKWGWSVGPGIELQLPQIAQGLAVRGEALYSRFSDQAIGPYGTVSNNVGTITIGAVKRF